jgi:putative hydrolase of the HAD superfamily
LTVADLLADALQTNGVTRIPRQYLEEAARTYEAAICAQAAAMPQAREVVAQVKAAGFKIGLVSNTMFSGQAHVADMARFGLLDYFDAMVFSADVDKWKPTAAPFLHVLDALGVAGETAVYIGDDPGSDVRGAKRAGMRAIHFHSSDRFAQPDDIQPDAQIKQLADLMAILSSWQ